MAQPQAQPSSNIPYDPIQNGPPSPRLPPIGQDLAPGGFYDNPAYRQSMSSLSPSFRPPAQFRDSEYGSVHGLNRDSAVLPAGAAAPAGAYRDDPTQVPMAELGSNGSYPEKREMYASPKTKRKRWVLVAIILAVLLLIALVVFLPIYFTVIKPKNDSESSSSNSNHGGKDGDKDGDKDGNGGDKSADQATWGEDGSIITTSEGVEFTYTNPHGGYWVFDPANPTNNSARSQSWNPALDEEFRYGVDKIRGVNIGGWLNLEPFISPAMYEEFYPDAIDEWTLCEQLMAKYGNLDKIEEHYKTFITEEDFAMIAGAGLNWIRLPIGFWAIEKYDAEPYLERVSWTYFLKAIEWARKYGLRIQLDLHALPGSQNGWNHSGKMGQINFLNGVMGIANAQRAMDYMRVLAEFISQPEYRDVVPMFGIINEPRTGGDSYPRAALESFYVEAYKMIRSITGIGAGNGPWISIHEGFVGPEDWAGFLAGADRVSMDFHPYFAFGGVTADGPDAYITRPCERFAPMQANTMRGYGLVTAGEWSNAFNDCGLYLNAVGRGTRFEGTFESDTRYGDCAIWNNWDQFSQQTKDDLRQFMMSSMDALDNYFFWTWNIGNSSATGKVETPFWSYKLALQEGWAPTDPREADGQCDRVGVPYTRFTGELPTWHVGGEGAGVVPTLDTYVWPPAAIGGDLPVATLPRYNPTGPVPTLPVPTYVNPETDEEIDMGDGWFSDNDTTLMSVPDPACAYPDPWDALEAAVPVCDAVPEIVPYTKRDFIPAAPQPAGR